MPELTQYALATQKKILFCVRHNSLYFFFPHIRLYPVKAHERIRKEEVALALAGPVINRSTIFVGHRNMISSSLERAVSYNTHRRDWLISKATPATHNTVIGWTVSDPCNKQHCDWIISNPCNTTLWLVDQWGDPRKTQYCDRLDRKQPLQHRAMPLVGRLGGPRNTKQRHWLGSWAALATQHQWVAGWAALATQTNFLN